MFWSKWFKKEKESSAVEKVHIQGIYSLEDAKRMGFYVGELGWQLDNVAQAMGANAGIRFNLERKCAELHDEYGRVIARISVHGECGGAYEAKIASQYPLPGAMKERFEKMLSVHVHFEVAT